MWQSKDSEIFWWFFWVSAKHRSCFVHGAWQTPGILAFRPEKGMAGELLHWKQRSPWDVARGLGSQQFYHWPARWAGCKLFSWMDTKRRSPWHVYTSQIFWGLQLVSIWEVDAHGENPESPSSAIHQETNDCEILRARPWFKHSKCPGPLVPPVVGTRWNLLLWPDQLGRLNGSWQGRRHDQLHLSRSNRQSNVGWREQNWQETLYLDWNLWRTCRLSLKSSRFLLFWSFFILQLSSMPLEAPPVAEAPHQVTTLRFEWQKTFLSHKYCLVYLGI
jgi:hypothetical protein